MSEPRRLRTRFSEFVPIHLATDEGVWLRIAGHGLDARFTYCDYTLIVHEHSGEEYPITILALNLYLRDAEAIEWHARKLIHSDLLWRHLQTAPVGFFHKPIEGEYVRFSKDEERERSFDSALYLEGVRYASDDGWRSSRIGPDFHFISYGFVGDPTFDFAAQPDAFGASKQEVSRFEVRLSGCSPYVDNASRERFYEHYVEGERHEYMAPLLFEIHFADLLGAEDAVFLAEDEQWETAWIPLPLVFRRTGETGEPQPGVTVVESYGG